MRIKFLSVIVSFLIVSFALSSCLDSDDNYEFSSDATIHAFGIDTIHGKHYKFTIDQLNRLIYNRDSLPVGSDTIIDRILIDTMTVTGWITSGSPTDTVFVMSDSVDLRPAMNNDAGMLFKAHAADGVTVREYKLKVNVHLQDPDSLVWTDMQKRGNIFSNTINLGQQKAVVLGDELFVYTSNSTAYKTSTAPDKYNWSKVNVSNLPSDVKLTSAVEYNNALYMVTESKRVFSSTNGGAWTEVTTLGDNVIVLINGFSDRLSGIVEINGKQYFNICKDGKKKYQSLGISVLPRYWDFTRNKPKPNCPNKEYIQKIILDKQTELQQRMLEFNSEQKEYTTTTLLNDENKRFELKTVCQFYQEQIEQCKVLCKQKIRNSFLNPVFSIYTKYFIAPYFL